MKPSLPIPSSYPPRSFGRRAHDKSVDEYRALLEGIRLSRNRYVNLYEFAPVVYTALDGQGRILDINLKGALIFGRPPSQLIRAPFSRFVIEEDVPLLSHHLERCRNTEKEETCELRLLTKHTERIPVQLTSLATAQEHGGVKSIQTAIIDLSERKRMEQQLLQKEQELHQARKLEAVGRLAGGVAHDFNNLLAGIFGIAQDLYENMAESDPRRADLSDMMSASQRAFALTRQLLAFGRRQPIAPRILDLNHVVMNTEKMLRRLLGEDIFLSFKRAEGTLDIKADEGQLQQLITNLVLNARDAMPKGGRIMIETARAVLSEEQVCVRADLRAGRYAVLRVEDTGVGMDAQALKRIFEPFFTTKTRDKGSGLGLAMVHGIVKQNGGEILVQSQLGKGTRFDIYLPQRNP